MSKVMDRLPVDQILQGDCLEVLPQMPEKSVDMIFADPPYNLQLSKKLWRPNSTRVNGVEESWDQFADFSAYDQFTSAWLSACRAVLKDHGTLWVIGSYHNIFRVGRLMQDIGFWILNDIVWIKNNPMPNFLGVRFTNAHETLIWAQKNRGSPYTFNYHLMKEMNRVDKDVDPLQMRSDWKLPLCTGKERIKRNGDKAHPTQKPEALLERVIRASSNPGDVILDPFFGTGTTGAVAKKYGRHWIGIEADASYISLAQQRIDAVQAGSGSDAVVESQARSKRRRIPFARIIEQGYIKPGQVLFFGRRGEIEASVLGDGDLQLGDRSGSIHQLGRELLNAPCNGWMTWYYIDEDNGKKMPINVLRQKLISEAALGGSMSAEKGEEK